MAKQGQGAVKTQVVGAMGTEPKSGASATNRETIRQQFIANLKKLKTLDPTSSAYNDLKNEIIKTGATLKYKTDNINNYITRNTKQPSSGNPPKKEDPVVGRFPSLSPEAQDKTLVGQGGQPFLNLAQYGDNFDPNNPYAKYETAFLQARNRAYNDVMGQFERSTQDEFARQNAQFQQRMAEQGIDPQSATYQGQYKALADAQARARQEAMSAATSKAYEVQNQAYTQASAAVNQLTELAKVGLIPWEKVQEARSAMERQEAVIAGEAARTTTTTEASKEIAAVTAVKAQTNPAAAGVQTSYTTGLLSGAASQAGRLV